MKHLRQVQHTQLSHFSSPGLGQAEFILVIVLLHQTQNISIIPSLQKGQILLAFLTSLLPLSSKRLVYEYFLYVPMSTKTLAVSKRTNVQQQLHSKRGKKGKQKQKNSKLQPSTITDVKLQTQFNH